MANKELNVKLLIKNSPASEWNTKNPILGKGELGFEIDTRKFKIGDGITGWTGLKYAGGNVEIKTTAPATTTTDYEVGTFWLNTNDNKVYLLVAKSTTAAWVNIAKTTDVVDEAVAAQKLLSARTICISGDVSGFNTFDGSSDKTIMVVLANTGVEIGTYTKLTVDSKGRVTSATQLVAADIPNLTLSKISDAGTAASKNIGTSAGQVPILDASGKLDSGIMPAVAITDTYVVANEAAMLALSVQIGDVAVRTDVTKSFILRATPATTLTNWQELLSPPNAVLSVNGKTGTITLSTSDIAEGTNLYYTAARDTANFNTNFAAKSVAGLSDGSKVLMNDDTITLNGGSA